VSIFLRIQPFSKVSLNYIDYACLRLSPSSCETRDLTEFSSALLKASTDIYFAGSIMFPTRTSPCRFVKSPGNFL